ncbi:16S rRNA (guanine(527)-N(7))-methyltransferase RsmG [bacterium]|nr:16S rRNA (guanine(527)-N(7))-methyltransferase RsmG [bacterium]MBU1985403.1 16S rRNA (guanine(527)-N(7))-methyltransferase RsmG [bacterium]
MGWSTEDDRWEQLAHYLERVRTAGLALVSQSDRERLLERHAVPSLEALDLFPDSGSVLDVGSGGGFPALPLALARPDVRLSLVESNERKASFLSRVSRETFLSNINVFNVRAEELGKEHESVYDIIIARAVADLPELIPWTWRFLAPAGRWILWKGQSWRAEGDLGRLGVRLLEERPLSDGGRLLVLVPLDD